MRPKPSPDNAIERVAIALNLAPLPVGDAMFGMPTARAVLAGVRLGLFARLAKGPATAAELASELELQEVGTRLLLDTLTAIGHVSRDGGRYALARKARRWLDPESDTYMGTFLLDAVNYWDWWGRLEEIVRTGESIEIHARDPGDPIWRTYIRGQWELARLSAGEVARRLRIPKGAMRLLDVAGGHGWYSAALCRRHPGLQATVFDLPGSAAVGREIIAEAGMSDRVRHVEGDALSDDLGGPYDAALCFNLIHHFDPEMNVKLLTRINDALVPGGTFAVLDLFASERKPDTGAMLGLFFYLTSSAATYTDAEVREWFGRAGFEQPRRIVFRRIPNQAAYEGKKPLGARSG